MAHNNEALQVKPLDLPKIDLKPTLNLPGPVIVKPNPPIEYKPVPDASKCCPCGHDTNKCLGHVLYQAEIGSQAAIRTQKESFNLVVSGAQISDIQLTTQFWAF